MVTSPLVEPYVEDGRKLLLHLQEKGFAIQAAYWLYLADGDQWRFVLSSHVVDEAGIREAYSRLLGLIPEDSTIGLSDIRLVSSTDKVSKSLQLLAGRRQGPSIVRVSKSMIDDQFVDDALIYRLPASAG